MAMFRYKPSTLHKFVSRVREQMALYRASREPLKVCITAGNEKIGRVLNVSLAPIITCGNCSGCMWHCYDLSSGLFRLDVLKARARNTCILEDDREDYFRQIINRIRRTRKCRFFRWHVGGEIPDMDYLEHMIEIARMFPEWRFWTYTKMYALINAYCRAHGNTRDCIPSNLSIMFSLWNGMECDNPYDFPVFACEMDGYSFPEIAHVCPSRCAICIANHTGCPFGVSSKTGLH